MSTTSRKDYRKLTLEEIKEKINQDPDFIYSPLYNFSLAEFLKHNPDGVKVERIAKLLKMTKEDVESTYRSALAKVQAHLQIDPEDLQYMESGRESPFESPSKKRDG